MTTPAKRKLLALAALSLGATACILSGRSPRARSPGEVDFKLDAFTYLEEGKLVALAVGTEAARYREKAKYVPFSIAIANKGAKTLNITRESFTLQDEDGKRYAAVPVSELSAGYGLSGMDRSFTGTFQVFLSRFSIYEPINSNFFPSRISTAITIDRVELPRYYRLFDWMYFPMPDGGVLKHRFELHFDCQGLEEGIFVKFLVN